MVTTSPGLTDRSMPLSTSSEPKLLRRPSTRMSGSLVYCVALVVYLILTLVASRLLEAFGKKLGAEAPATLPSSN